MHLPKDTCATDIGQPSSLRVLLFHCCASAPQTDLKHFNLESSLRYAWLPCQLTQTDVDASPETESHGTSNVQFVLVQTRIVCGNEYMFCICWYITVNCMYCTCIIIYFNASALVGISNIMYWSVLSALLLSVWIGFVCIVFRYLNISETKV